MRHADLIDSRAEWGATNLWPVYGSYEVRKDGYLWQPSELLVREYSPAGYPQLLTDLAKASDGSREAIENFALRWGSLGYSSLLGVARTRAPRTDDLGQPLERPTARHLIKTRPPRSMVGRETRTDPVAWIVAHARGINLCLDLLDLLYPADGTPCQASALDGILQPLRGHLVETLVAYEPKPVERPAIAEPLIDRDAPQSNSVIVSVGEGSRIFARRWSIEGSLEEAAKQIIADIVTANTQGMGPSLDLVEGRLVMVQGYDALIEMAYWHVARVAESKELLAKCEAQDCRHFFVKTDGRQRFCPPDPWAGKGAESRCARRDRAPKKKTRGAS